VHPRNASSTLLNQSRSAKPVGTITSSPSPADFRTPASARSNLHSVPQPSYSTSRAFLHWRLSDDGPGASRIVPIGRHPKPFTRTDMVSRTCQVRNVPMSGSQSIYSITSSAVKSNSGGISTPSALAVLRLIAISNFVGCSTGRSAGFSPLRIRPA